MKIDSYVGEYEAEFYHDFSFFDEIKKLDNKFFVIDSMVYDLYKDELSRIVADSPSYLVDAIEENKNIYTSLDIISKMVELPSKRNTYLVAVGGGIVQDIAAFTANVIYRGIEWALIPTTLLAQADSCIGSKSSLNFDRYKNLIGYFYPPTKIYINTGFLGTLEKREMLSGVGEMMKCAIMAGRDSFRGTAGNIPAVLGGDHDAMIAEIKKALAFKKSVIEMDEFDRGYRNIMNFGHTFGHALESTSDYAIPHGQGVSIGILIANEISRSRGNIDDDYCREMREALKSIISEGSIKKEFFEEENYLKALKKDKKYTGKAHTCILADEKGVRKYNDITDGEVMQGVSGILESIN